MHGPLCPRLQLVLPLVLLSWGAWGQESGTQALQELDPDAKPATAAPKEAVEPQAAKPAEKPKPVRPAPKKLSADKGGPTEKVAEAAPKRETSKLPPILVGTVDDRTLEAAWRELVAALGGNSKGLAAAKAHLLRLKSALGATSLEPYSVALARAAQSRQEAGDESGTVELALLAVELSPELPHAHVALAKAYYFADISEIGRYASELKLAAAATFKDPRYARALAAQLGAAALMAVVATALLVTALAFLRRARLFMHDFHHFFPSAAAFWQTGILAVALLGLPWLLRLGLAWGLLALLAASALYLSSSERVVGAVLLSLLGLVPLLGGQLAQRTAFAGTVAEELDRLERGGPGNEAIVERLLLRAQAEKASFQELFALGRYELRRGQEENAITHLKAALAERTQEPRALVNLANAMLAKGDLEGPLTLYEETAKNPQMRAISYFNLSRLRARRAAAASSEEARVMELDRAQDARSTAAAADPALEGRPEPPPEDLQLNALVLSPGLSSEELSAVASDPELGERVRAQFARALLGGWGGAWAPVYLLGASALLVAFGSLQRSRRVARSCQKCGRSVCRKCDPELPAGGVLCAQCVNVFTRSGVAAAALTVQKQIEVARYQSSKDKLRFLLGALLAGAGHLLMGLPARGASYLFGFLFCGSLLVLHEGLVRMPHDGLPSFVLLVPTVLVVGVLYLLSLRAMVKRQAG